MSKALFTVGAAAAAIILSVSNLQAAPVKPVTTKATIVNTTDLSELSSAAVKHFNKTFGEDINANWSEMKSGYRASFRKDDVLHLVDYNQRGTWVSTIRIYSENAMPVDVRAQIKSIYYDYSIASVTEVTANNNTVYFVKMQDENSLKTLRVLDGEMDIIQEFNRADH